MRSRRWAEPLLPGPGAAALLLIIAVLLPPPAAAQDSAAPLADGTVRGSGAAIMAWDAQAGAWRTPLDFWHSYASRRGGLSWGRRDSYPPYAEVSELDTLIIETAEGPCLMEFFHRRWRRANDVRRWDDAFNNWGGCPYVFD